MAFLKTARAIVANPSMRLSSWEDFRTHALSDQGSNPAFSKTSSLNLSQYTPERYLLTHCTIIASVDTDEVPNVKTGEIIDNGRKVKRLFSNYHIKPESARYVNQNGDAWERELLLSCFRTFVGAENYVEHVQIPELSKGKVIDAVARDLEDTVYIDILVATDKKHASLVADIESGKMNSLSMGCSIQYSQCSQCGNVAADDTELCDHVRYYKNSEFIDHSGQRRIVAELCGHKSDPESVTFIEASWVATPAFKGAMMRNILNPDQIGRVTPAPNATPEVAQKAAFDYASLFSTSPLLQQFLESGNLDGFSHTANLKTLQNEMRRVATAKAAFGFGGDDEEEAEPAEEKSLVEEIKDDVTEDVKKDVKRKVKDEVEKDLGVNQDQPEFKGEPEKEDLNDTVINSFQHFASRYASELGSPDTLRKVFLVALDANQKGWGAVKNSSQYGNREIVAAMYIRDRDYEDLAGSRSELYPCLLKVGGTRNYANKDSFLNACSLALGRTNLSHWEKAELIKMAKVLK